MPHIWARSSALLERSEKFESCGPEMSAEDRLANRTGVVHADAHAMDVMCELTLIASPDLARKATLAGQNVSKYADRVVLGEGAALNLNALRDRLCEAMRADLGESAERSANCPRYGHWWPEDGRACLDCSAPCCCAWSGGGGSEPASAG